MSKQQSFSLPVVKLSNLYSCQTDSKSERKGLGNVGKSHLTVPSLNSLKAKDFAIYCRAMRVIKLQAILGKHMGFRPENVAPFCNNSYKPARNRDKLL